MEIKKLIMGPSWPPARMSSSCHVHSLELLKAIWTILGGWFPMVLEFCSFYLSQNTLFDLIKNAPAYVATLLMARIRAFDFLSVVYFSSVWEFIHLFWNNFSLKLSLQAYLQNTSYTWPLVSPSFFFILSNFKHALRNRSDTYFESIFFFTGCSALCF